MTNEPLKRSFMGEIIHPDFTEPDKDTYYLKQDIELAVEWLDKNIDRIAPRHKADYTSLPNNRKSGWKLCNCKVCSKVKEIKSLIKEAFPDLYPKGSDNSRKTKPSKSITKK